MKKALPVALMSLTLFYLPTPATATLSEPPAEGVAQTLRVESGDNEALSSELRLMLETVSRQAVKDLSRVDSYFSNRAIKIAVPDEMEHIPFYLLRMGHAAAADKLVLAMNRSAERAAARAEGLFSTAISELVFDDPKAIVNNTPAGASSYLRKKSYDRLYKLFRPIMVSSMNEGGVADICRSVVDNYYFEQPPNMKVESFDLEDHLTSKALDGLFTAIATEEQRLRQNWKSK